MDEIQTEQLIRTLDNISSAIYNVASTYEEGMKRLFAKLDSLISSQEVISMELSSIEAKLGSEDLEENE